jgi:hypothetical protein
LIRSLALLLSALVPGKDLEAERRGLEIPFQALQAHYAPLNDGDLDAQRILLSSNVSDDSSPKPSLAPKIESTNEPASSLAAGLAELVPHNCAIANCTFVETADYQLYRGGFVVKSLSSRLILVRNFVIDSDRPLSRWTSQGASNNRAVNGGFQIDQSATSGTRSTSISPLIQPDFANDPGRVDDCFGRCGAGCTGWTDEFIGEPNVQEEGSVCEAPYHNPNIEGFCLEECDTTLHTIRLKSGPVHHETSGKVTTLCELHDACVRNSPLGVLDPFCNIIFAPALLDLLSGAGTLTYWSYDAFDSNEENVYNSMDPGCVAQASDCCQTHSY